MEWTHRTANPRDQRDGPSRLMMVLAVAAFVVLLLDAVLTQVVSAEVADVIGPLGVLLGYVAGGTVISRGALHLKGRERTAWRLVGFGFTVGAMGILAVAIVDTVTGAAPAFGPTDLLFIAAYVLVLAGLFSMPHVTGSSVQRARITLDGLIGAISVAVLLWAFVVRDLFDSLGESPLWERWMGSTYPVMDIALIITVMIVVMRRSSYRFDLRLLILGAGLSMQAVGDLTYLVSGVGKTFEEANPFYPLYLLAGASFVVTGLLLYRPPTHREYPDRGTPWWAMIAPYGAAAIMLAVAVSHLWGSALELADFGLLLATILVGALVIGRQAVAIRDNRRMVEREREALVSSISHELRTPLTSIVGFVNLYVEEAEAQGEETSELITVVQQESLYMARIVEDLMMLARNDPHAMELKDEPFDVRQQINVSVRAVDIDPMSVTVECDPLLGVVADRARFQQIMVNLLSNATRYGGPARLVVAHENEGGLLLEVHDNGHGVPRKHEIVIWRRFERGANRLNGAVPGSGIGLAIVDSLAKAYSGSTGYRRSERLGGACFWVDLPGRVTAHQAYRAPEEAVNIGDLAPVEPNTQALPSRVPERRSGW